MTGLASVTRGLCVPVALVTTKKLNVASQAFVEKEQVRLLSVRREPCLVHGLAAEGRISLGGLNSAFIKGIIFVNINGNGVTIAKEEVNCVP